jgi:cobalt/nickel transport protein
LNVLTIPDLCARLIQLEALTESEDSVFCVSKTVLLNNQITKILVCRLDLDFLNFQDLSPQITGRFVMKYLKTGVCFLLGLLFWAGSTGNARAHFGMIIPSTEIVSQESGGVITLTVMFAHPFERNWMDMEKPVRFGVKFRGARTENLLPLLKPIKIQGHRAWKATYRLKRPGDYVFFDRPQPYFEPAEGKFISHFTKVIVNGYGMEEGWDKEIGLKTEIVPLTRPYGMYAGNVFRGLVLVEGKPAPFCRVEIEYDNIGEKFVAPAGPFINQVVKTDQKGVFAYAMPVAGWWGFAALNQDKKKIAYKGKSYPVELGAVLWVRTRDMERKK